MKPAIPFFCLISLAFSLCAGAQSQVASTAAPGAVTVGTIRSVTPASTQVLIQNPQGKQQERAVGQDLALNEHVLPKAGQTVVLQLKDGSEVTAAPGSDLVVFGYIPGRPGSVPHIEVTRGSGHFLIVKSKTGRNSFYVHTPSATMGVRGTEFIVDYTQTGASYVHTLDGTVAIAKTEADLADPNRSVSVPAGRMSYITRSLSQPAEARRFNRKAYLSSLAKAYPGLMNQVIRANQIERENQNSNSKRDERLDSRKKAQDERDELPPKRRSRQRRN